MHRRIASILLLFSMLFAPLGAFAQGTFVMPSLSMPNLSLPTLALPVPSVPTGNLLDSLVPALSGVPSVSDEEESSTEDSVDEAVEEDTSDDASSEEDSDDSVTEEETTSEETAETSTSLSVTATSETSETTTQTEESVVTETETQTTTTEALTAEEYVPTAVGDPVLFWNDIALQAVASDHTGTFGPPQQGGPTKASRALAIVHAAIYDAVNSIIKTHKPYLTMVPIRPNAKMKPSIDAAVAQAANMTLASLYPAQKAIFTAKYKEHMDAIPGNVDKMVGMNIGRVVAYQILNVRRRDGSDKNVVYTPSNQPGKHRPDPLNPLQGYLGPGWGLVKPFAILSSSQFRSLPPPLISSQEYAEAYEEVLNYGGDGVTTAHHRDQNQSEMAIYWGYDGTKSLGVPPRLYNQITRMIAQQMGNSVAENARLFALVNLAQADAGIGAWESKYFYDYWRPVVGIREADVGTGPTGLGDGNPLTEGDPTWTPLGAPASNQSNGGVNFTPPFPAYPSGHATFGGATFHILELFYGTDAMPFTFMSDEMNGVTTDNVGNVRPAIPRSFALLSDAMEENGQSRIYLGIHWKFDKTAGIAMGKAIADYIYAHILGPAN